jgi:hypothetical protein
VKRKITVMIMAWIRREGERGIAVSRTHYVQVRKREVQADGR